LLPSMLAAFETRSAWHDPARTLRADVRDIDRGVDPLLGISPLEKKRSSMSVRAAASFTTSPPASARPRLEAHRRWVREASTKLPPTSRQASDRPRPGPRCRRAAGGQSSEAARSAVVDVS